MKDPSAPDAFVAMPGGFGTFEEFCEAVTWTQLGVHRKPCGLLNVEGYYDPLLALFDRAVSLPELNGLEATRQIVDIMPPSFPADRLLVCEVFTPAGNWSSSPPHKHDRHAPPLLRLFAGRSGSGR